MRVLSIALMVLAVATVLSCSTGNVVAQTVSCSVGCIPINDEKNAAIVGGALLTAVFGEEVMSKEKPITANLKDGIWYVRGTSNLLPFQKGGFGEIRLSQKCGEVLFVTHGE